MGGPPLVPPIPPAGLSWLTVHMARAATAPHDPNLAQALLALLGISELVVGVGVTTRI